MTSTIPTLQPRAHDPRGCDICPAAPSERAAALSVLFHRFPRRTRESLFRWSRRLCQDNPSVFNELVIAKRGRDVRGVVWGQPVPGGQTMIWLPVRVNGEPRQTDVRLLTALDQFLASQPTRVALATLKPDQLDVVSSIGSLGFRYITDLARMSCSVSFDFDPPTDPRLAFDACMAADQARLSKLIVRTYQDSLDCPAMRGLRNIDDVMQGHLSSLHGTPPLWRILRYGDTDAGCVLVARDEERPECNVSYLGLIPEARGRGWGRILIRQAQQLVRAVGLERLSLSCDVSNPPALKTYQRAGFREFDRFCVFVKAYR